MRSRLAVVAALAVVAIVIVVSLKSFDRRPSKGDRLRVLFSGETMGELEPCDCAGEMAGGLPARGSYVDGQSGEHLLLDVGCIGGGARDFEILRMKAALRGMAVMRYDAANIAEHELWLGRDKLRELMDVGVPFVSANTVDENGAPVFAPYLLLSRSGLSVAVTGVVESGRYETGPFLHVKSPREVLGRLIPELRKKAGVIIVLADLELRAVRDLAADFPEITAILFRGRGDSHAPERVNRTIIASIYGEARYMGDLTLTWETARRVTAEGEAVLLDERFSPSVKVHQECIEWYKHAVKGRTFDLTQAGPGWSRIQPEQPEPGNHYVGSESCRKCHPYQYKVWSGNRHSRAMKSVQKVGYDWSPECITCHVVGFGALDGYKSMKETETLGRVGCEACHGRGHVLRKGNCKGLARRGSEATCRRCHTPKRHPEFNYERSWGFINHKEKKK